MAVITITNKMVSGMYNEEKQHIDTPRKKAPHDFQNGPFFEGFCSVFD